MNFWYRDDASNRVCRSMSPDGPLSMTHSAFAPHSMVMAIEIGRQKRMMHLHVDIICATRLCLCTTGKLFVGEVAVVAVAAAWFGIFIINQKVIGMWQ
jgi:hypothetical protein